MGPHCSAMFRYRQGVALSSQHMLSYWQPGALSSSRYSKQHGCVTCIFATYNIFSLPSLSLSLSLSLFLSQIIEQSQTTPTCISLGFSDIDDDSILAFLRFIYTGSSPSETDDNVDLKHHFSLLLERWGRVVI